MEAKVEEKDNTLSHNIKYLRKENKFSQEELANRLGIKRSNIAAYESKNVEPRLRIILELARLFNVSVKTLIEKKIARGSISPAFDVSTIASTANVQELDIENNIDIAEFIGKSIRIRKVLEGFKSFYTFKKNNMKESTPDKDKLIFDIDNFVQLMEHLLAYNETVIKAISSKTSPSQ
ncbi:MAG: transcriptional regulator with XRE-family HTH domain [Saprospiraceae bacterium]|jgi:transcriptional regulator with XRE-family HTH domain